MKKMNEFMTELTETATMTTNMTKKEYFLTISTCLLGGIVIGMLCSPRKYTKIGCENGSNNSNNEVRSTDNLTGGGRKDAKKKNSRKKCGKKNGDKKQ